MDVSFSFFFSFFPLYVCNTPTTYGHQHHEGIATFVFFFFFGSVWYAFSGIFFFSMHVIRLDLSIMCTHNWSLHGGGVGVFFFFFFVFVFP